MNYQWKEATDVKSKKLFLFGFLLSVLFGLILVALWHFLSPVKKETSAVSNTVSKMEQDLSLDKKTSSSEKMSDSKNKKLAWTCPMHPQVRKDEHGKCPICGMTLVEEQDSPDVGSTHQHALPEGHAPFQLSNNRIQMIGVKYGIVEKRPLFKSIESAGRVAFDPELYTAQSEYVEAVRQLGRVKDSTIAEVKHSAERMIESAKLRLKILGLSDSQISKLKTTGGGTSGSNLLLTTSGENVWVYAEVFEMDLPNVESGQEAKISGGSLEGRILVGKVISVDRVISSVTRTAKVRILVPNAKTQLRPESYVDVSILSALGEQVVVPFDAILDSGKEAWVFVAQDDGHFEPRVIGIKDYLGEEVAVSMGLHAGERIVTSANFLIDSESRLKGVLAGQAGQSIQPENKQNVQTDRKQEAQVDGKQNDQTDHQQDGQTDHQQDGQTDHQQEKRSQPSCPKGQVWHPQMGHCMTKVGG